MRLTLFSSRLLQFERPKGEFHMALKTARRLGAAVLLTAAVSIPVTIEAQELLVLEVDRFSGATTLRNPSSNTTPIELISYTLNSFSSPLDSSNARWKSFQDTGKPGWFEANPTGVNLSELDSAAPLSMTPGNSHDFGTPFTANASAPLRTDWVNLSGASFIYQIPDGSLKDVEIQKVGRFNDLVLVVNPTTGFATLQNQSAQSIEFISYTISSSSGALLSSYAGSGRPGWFTANPTANNLSELASGSSIVLNTGGEVNLGNAWSTSGVQDLTLSYQSTNGTLLPGTVFFGAKAVFSNNPGDYNGDGNVDAADYVVWRKNPGAHGGDPGGYDTWRANFGGTGVGGGASADALDLSAVPEPASSALIAFVVLGRELMRRRKKAA
jgi:hypothetical protein